MVSVLGLSSRHVCCSDLFRKFVYSTTPHFQPIQIGKELSDIRSKSLRGRDGLSFGTLIQTCMLLRLVSQICLFNNFGS